MVVAALVFVFGGPAIADATLHVDWANGLLTVDADAAPRSQILGEIARRAGIDVVGLGAVGDEVMTLHLVRVDAFQAIRRLLDGRPSVVVEERAPNGDLQVTSIRIFTDSDTAASEQVGPHDSDDGVRRALWHGDDQEADAAQAALEARDPAAMVREVLIASRSETSEQRMRALRLLDRAGSVERATTVAAMGEAMTDADETVKALAFRALAVRGEEGLAMLRRAFRDGSRDDRLMVLQAVSERDRDSVLLREALADPDPQVRRFAESRLFNSGAPGGR